MVLRRQQASAVIAARKLVGAVNIVGPESVNFFGQRTPYESHRTGVP
jgi:hypothetical protein